MNPSKNIIILMLALWANLVPLHLMADEISGKDVEIRFRFEGLAKFSEFDFYFFKNLEGIPQTADTIWAKDNFVYSVRAGETLEWMPASLFARSKKDHDALFISSGELGGADVMNNFDIDYIIQDWKLSDVEDGTVFLKFRKAFQVKVNSNEEEKLNQNGFLQSPSGPKLWGVPILIAITPLICLFVLAWAFVYRIKNRRYSPV